MSIPRLSVLLVEDSPSDALLVERSLDEATAFCEVTRVERLARAIAPGTDGHDVALLDLGLPDSQGLETLTRFRGAHPRLPVIVLTGLDDEEVALRALSAGAQDYVLKSQLEGRAMVRSIRYAVERARAEEALRDSEERYRAIFDCSPYPSWVVDQETLRFLEVNEAALRKYGWSRAEFLGMTILDIRPPEERAAAREAAAIIGPSPTNLPRVWRHLGKDGREFLVEISTQRFLYRGRPALMTVSLDVTAKIRAEEERRRLEEELRQAQKMDAVGKLAGGIAHDFNNLLTVINGYADVLLSGSEPLRPQAREMLGEVAHAGARASDLTRQLLAFSRKQVLEPRLIDPNAVVSDIHRLLVRLLGENIRTSLELAPRVGAVHADRGQLEQVLLNLAVNARDAMPSGGLLTVGTAEETVGEGGSPRGVPPGRWVVLTVADTGTGMDAETLSHVFEPFFTTKEKGKGTGLGLATVWGIVRQSGGHISVESAPGAGARFRVHLPRAADPQDDPLPGPDRAAPAGAPTVLVVDDEPGVRSLMQAALEADGLAVLAAANAEEALRLAEAQASPIALVIADIGVPGADGVELVTRLRRRRPALRALFVSGYADRPDGMPPADPFLAKPFTAASLGRAVRDLLASAGTRPA